MNPLVPAILQQVLLPEAQAQFTSDTFSGTSGTNLTTHTATDGSTWTAFLGTATLDGSGGVYAATSNIFHYVGNAGHKPANGNFDVIAQLNFLSMASGQSGIWVYESTTGGTNYWGMFWNTVTSKWELQWKQAGVQQTVTEFATSNAPTTGSTPYIKLAIRNSSVTGYISTDGGTTYSQLFTRATNPLDTSTPLGVGVTATTTVTSTTGTHFQNFKAFNVTPPVFSSASVPSAGTSVTINFTVPGTSPLLFGSSSTATGAGGFTVNVGGSPVTVSSATASTTSVTLNLASTVYSGQAVTVAYATGGNGNLQDSATNPNTVSTFAAQSVTNNSTQSSSPTGYTITPNPNNNSTVASGSTINLPISLTGGSTVPTGGMTINAALGNGLTGSWASSTSGVSVVGNAITIAAGTYSGAIDLRFITSGTCTNGTITLTHTGGGFSGGDPGPYTYSVAVLPSFALSPATIYTNSSGNLVSATGSNTSWLSGTTFSVSGGTGSSVTTSSVNAGAQTANLLLSAGSAGSTTLTISDTADSATQTVSVVTPSQSISSSPTTLLVGNTVTITVTGTNTLYSSQSGEYFSLGGTAGASSSITNTTINSDTSATLTVLLGNTTGTISVIENAPYGGGATSNNLNVTSSGGTITYTGKITQSANGPSGITMTAPTPAGISGSAVYTWRRSATPGFAFSSGTVVGTNSATITDNPGTSGQTTLWQYKVQIADTGGSTPAITGSADAMTTSQWGAVVQVGGMGDSVIQGQGLTASTNVLAQFVLQIGQNYGFHTAPYTNSINNQGKGGSATTDWLPTSSTNYYANAKAAWLAMSPSLTDVIIELMTNDITKGNTATTFGNNMKTIIDQVHTDFPNVRIWVTDSPIYPIHNDTDITKDLGYIAQMDNLCSTSGPEAALVNAGLLYRLDKAWAAQFGSNKTANVQIDNVHPTAVSAAAGGALWAYAFAKGLGLIGTTTTGLKTRPVGGGPVHH